MKHRSITSIITCFSVLSILLLGCSAKTRPIVIPVFVESVEITTMTPFSFQLDMEIPASSGFHVVFLEDGATRTSIEGTQKIPISADGPLDHFIFSHPGKYQWQALVLDGEKTVATTTITIEVLPLPWSLFVWMAADNNLSDDSFAFDLKSLEEMRYASTDVGIFVMWDRQVHQGPDQLLALSQEGDWVTLDYFEENVNSGDIRFFEQVFKRYLQFDSHRKAAVFWSHGSGWIIAPNLPRAIAYDRPSGWWLNIRDLATSIERILNDHGIGSLDILGMDACVMGSVEVAWELSNTAEYLILSPTTVPGEGWDYSFLERISAKDCPETFGSDLIEAYFSKHLPSYEGDIALSMIRSESLPHLIDRLDKFAQEVLSIVEPDRSALQDAMMQTPFLRSNNPAYGVDMGRLFQTLKQKLTHDHPVHPLIEPASHALDQSIVQGMSRYQRVFLDYPAGLSIYLPHHGYSQTRADQYQQYQFSKDALWDEMIFSLWSED